MTKTDDWIRITLRLPPRLHARISKAAAISESSLNSKIIDLLSQGLETDLETHLASLDPRELPKELGRMVLATGLRFKELARAVEEVRAEQEAKAQTKKDVA
jgi:HicB family